MERLGTENRVNHTGGEVNRKRFALRKAPEEDTNLAPLGAKACSPGREPRGPGRQTIQSPVGATAISLEEMICRRPYGALGFSGPSFPGAHAPGYMPRLLR